MAADLETAERLARFIAVSVIGDQQQAGGSMRPKLDAEQVRVDHGCYVIDLRTASRQRFRIHVEALTPSSVGGG